MKIKDFIRLLMISIILLVLTSCTKTTPQNAQILPTSTSELLPQITEKNIHTITITATDSNLTPEPTLEPTFTETVETFTETTTPIEDAGANLGSIIYVLNEDLWLYNIDTGDNQEFYDGESGISRPELSPDGQFLSFYEDHVLKVMSMEDKKLINISEDNNVTKWIEESHGYFWAPGDTLESCYELENIEDQDDFKIEIYWVNFGNEEHPELLASISGGVQEVQSISKDNVWASILDCRCFSECGGHTLWHLPTQTRLSFDLGFSLGSVSFSSDSAKAAFSAEFIHYYEESPLVVVELNNPKPTIIYSQPGIAIKQPSWSPYGNWIAFQAFSFDEEGQKIIKSQLMVIQPDGNNPLIIGGEHTIIIDWSPDGENILLRQFDENEDYLYILNLNTASETHLPFTVRSSFSVDWGFLQ